jgi:hypothetical protein
MGAVPLTATVASVTVPYTTPFGMSWAIDDPVIRFRVLGTERVYNLAASDRWMIGSAPDCSLRLDDPSGRTSSHHAIASRDGEIWTLHDQRSTNGLRVNGETRRTFQLTPCDEIKIGGITLLAESHRSITLLELVRQCLGWSISRLPEADRALRDIRDTAHLRAALILRGMSSLSGVARRLHRIILGDQQPFVVLGPCDDGMEGADRARNGTLCVDASGLPRDFRLMLASIRALDMRARLVICAESPEAVTGITTMISRIVTISLPRFDERPADEIERLLEVCATDAAEELGAPHPGLRPCDPTLVRLSGVSSFDEMEYIARRLVVLRNYGVAHGADRLNITHGALSRWARRRKLPT